MKLLAIEASTRADSATDLALDNFLSEQENLDLKKFRLKDLALPLFSDERGTGKWQSSPALETLLEDMIWADKIVLASPLYWYSVSHLMKNYLDHWTYYLRHSKYPLKDSMKHKPFIFLVVGHGEQSELTESVFAMLRHSIDFIGAKTESEIYLTESIARDS